MLPHHDKIIAWDALPLHPHRPGDLLSVRTPTKGEVSQFGAALRLLQKYVEAERIVAVGKRAFQQLTSLSQTSIYVRHPSQGGKTLFATAMRRLFES